MNNATLTTVKRFTHNPIITQDMLVGVDGHNINGSSLIAAPEWLPNRLGRFYLYFAHHRGGYIRLAYADQLEGPWEIYHPGTLRLSNARGCRDHIASPDVHVDHANKKINMFFHGVETANNMQSTFLASSSDGIHFAAGSTPLAGFYLRVVPWRNIWIGMAKGGILYLSDTGLGDFRLLADSAFSTRAALENASGGVRHVALAVADDNLQVYFTRIGDKPERIFLANIDLSQPQDSWYAKNIELVLAPETAWEGADIAIAESRPGAATGRENAVRDPAIFIHDNHRYLLYSVAGESGIAIAELTETGNRIRHKLRKTGELLSYQLLNPNNLAPDEVYSKVLNQLAQPGNLAARTHILGSGLTLQHSVAIFKLPHRSTDRHVEKHIGKNILGSKHIGVRSNITTFCCYFSNFRTARLTVM